MLGGSPEQLSVGRIHLQGICCHPVANINEALSEMRDGECGGVQTLTVHVYLHVYQCMHDTLHCGWLDALIVKYLRLSYNRTFVGVDCFWKDTSDLMLKAMIARRRRRVGMGLARVFFHSQPTRESEEEL